MEVQELAPEPNFLEPHSTVTEFECPLCLEVARDPVLSSCCGQHFCCSCIQDALAVNSVCPMCNEASIDVIRDKKRGRKMERLRVGCERREEGCAWEGTWGDLGLHIRKECQYTLIPCPKECSSSYQRREIPKHPVEDCLNRKVVCQYCAFVCSHRDAEKHRDVCTMLPIPCPNRCSGNRIEREKMDAHLLKCPLHEVECTFSHAGCTVRPARTDLDRHRQESLQEHLSLLSQLCLELNQRLMKREEQVDSLVSINVRLLERQEEMQSTLDNLKLTSLLPPVTFSLHRYTTYRDSLRSLRWDRSPAIYTHAEGCRLRLCLLFCQSSGTKADLELWQVPSYTDAEVEWPVSVVVTVTILRACQERKEHSIEREGGRGERKREDTGGRGEREGELEDKRDCGRRSGGGSGRGVGGREEEGDSWREVGGKVGAGDFSQSKQFVLERQEEECCVGDICYLYYSGLNNYVTNDSVRFRMDIVTLS